MNPVYLLERSPDAAVLTCTFGIVLIYIELNRPGTILPGAAGLLMLLAGAAALTHFKIWWPSLILLTLATLTLLLDLRRKVTALAAVLTTVAITLGLTFLVRGTGQKVHIVTALTAGIILGAGTTMLTGIARRARVNKGLDLQ